MAPVNGLTGQDLVQSPSVLRGMSPSGTMIGLPAALERDEEAQVCGAPNVPTPDCWPCTIGPPTRPILIECCPLSQLVREALFFVATTDSQRTLTAAACANSDGESSSEGDYIFTSEELLRQVGMHLSLSRLLATLSACALSWP